MVVNRAHRTGCGKPPDLIGAAQTWPIIDGTLGQRLRKRTHEVRKRESVGFRSLTVFVPLEEVGKMSYPALRGLPSQNTTGLGKGLQAASGCRSVQRCQIAVWTTAMTQLDDCPPPPVYDGSRGGIPDCWFPRRSSTRSGSHQLNLCAVDTGVRQIKCPTSPTVDVGPTSWTHFAGSALGGKEVSSFSGMAFPPHADHRSLSMV